MFLYVTIVISILFVAKSDENAFQSRTKYFSGHDFEVRAVARTLIKCPEKFFVQD